MAQGRLIPLHGEAIVLRTWPFHEADLVVSLMTREQGVVKGVARHAMRSRRRFGGALEPGTHVTAHYTERPREDLVRLDSLEILWSPLSAPMEALRLTGMQLVLEVLEQALPELAPEDNIFRLALATLKAMEPIACGPEAANPEHPQGSQVWLPVTYFSLWMNRLMGWLPELGRCSVCGLDLRDPERQREGVWWSPVADGVTCSDDRKPDSSHLSTMSVGRAYAMGYHSLPGMLSDLPELRWSRDDASDLRVFTVASLERRLERRLRSALARHAARAALSAGDRGVGPARRRPADSAGTDSLPSCAGSGSILAGPFVG